MTQEMKIRKGQAFNLAVADAIAEKKQDDPKYIYQRVVYYFELAAVVQVSDTETILEVLNNPDFDKAIKAFKEVTK